MTKRALCTGRSVFGSPFVIVSCDAKVQELRGRRLGNAASAVLREWMGEDADPDSPAWELGWKCYYLGLTQDQMRNETERQGWEAAQAHNQRCRRGYRNDAPKGAK